jgi:threonine aldolase
VLDSWTVDADGSAILRACTSWASKEEDVDRLIAML